LRIELRKLIHKFVFTFYEQEQHERPIEKLWYG